MIDGRVMELWVDSYSPYYAVVTDKNVVIHEITNWKKEGMSDMFDSVGLQQWLRDNAIINPEDVVL